MSSGLQVFVQLGNLHGTSNYVLYWIHGINYSKWIQIMIIWAINGTLTSTTTQAHSGPGSNGNEESIPFIIRCRLVSYTGCMILKDEKEKQQQILTVSIRHAENVFFGGFVWLDRGLAHILFLVVLVFHPSGDGKMIRKSMIEVTFGYLHGICLSIKSKDLVTFITIISRKTRSPRGHSRWGQKVNAVTTSTWLKRKFLMNIHRNNI